MLRLSTVLSGSTASAPAAGPPNVDARVGDGCAYSESAVGAALAVLAWRSEALVVGVVKGGGAGCVRGWCWCRGRVARGVSGGDCGAGVGTEGEVRRLGGVKAVGLPVCEK